MNTTEIVVMLLRLQDCLERAGSMSKEEVARLRAALVGVQDVIWNEIEDAHDKLNSLQTSEVAKGGDFSFDNHAGNDEATRQLLQQRAQGVLAEPRIDEPGRGGHRPAAL